jgi:drug/metabolite transporter (DMT)-like permease
MSSPAVDRDAFDASDWGLLASAALMWGSSFLLIAIALEDMHPGLITFLRLVFGAAVLVWFPAARRSIPRREWRAIALLGTLWMALPLMLFPIAQQWIDSSIAGMLNGAVPLFAAAAGILLFNARLSRVQAAGLLMGFSGVILIGLPSLQDGRATALGTGLVIVATVCYGIALNLAVPLQQRYGSLPVLVRAQAVAIVLTLPFGLLGWGSSAASWEAILAVGALGCLGTALAFVAMATLVGRVGAARGSVAIYFIPVVAIILGTVFRNEEPAPISLAGAALVILGAYVTSRRDKAPVIAPAA